MAGTKNTNRHLQRILLRGLVFPAAAAGAIILGATAASADEGPGSGTLQDTTAVVQSTVEDTGGSAAEVVEAQPEPAETAGSTSEGQQAVTGESSTYQTPLQQTQDAVAETAPVAVRDVEDAAAAETPLAQPNAGSGDQLASEATSPVAAVAQDTSRATEPLAESSDLVQPAPAPRDQLIEPVTQVVGQQAEAAQSTTSGAAEQVTRQVAEVADIAVAPVANLAAEVGDQADDTVTRSTETIIKSVSGVADLDEESTPIFEALSEELRRPVTETTPLFDTVTRDLTGTVTGGTAGDLLTPVTETTNGLTRDLISGLLTPVTESGNGLTRDLTSGLLTPLTQTANSLTRDLTGGVTSGLLTPLTQTTSGLLTPLTQTANSLTRDLTSGPLTPLTQTANSLTRDLTSGLLTPLTQTANSLTGVALAPASASTWLATAQLAEGSFVCTRASAGAGISTSAACSESAPGPATVNVRNGVADLPLAESSYPFPWAPDSISTWDALAQAGTLTVPGSDPTAAGGTAPLGQPFGPLGGIVEGLSSAGGSGIPGPSGSIFWLFVAMLGSAVILRNGGLSQLASGTATILSGRAALVHDRPG